MEVGRFGSREVRMRRSAFSLVELLVVIAVVGLLVALGFPALRKARTGTKRTVCASQLRQVGIGLLEYLHDNRDRLPYASFMPSMGGFPLQDGKVIAIATVLIDGVGGDAAAFQCPNDEPDDARPAPNTGKSFFQSENSSYEYRVQLGGLSLVEAAARFERRRNDPVSDNAIWLLRDYNNFHGIAGANGARRYVYSDGHVTDFEN